jgi:hypothetical protein
MVATRGADTVLARREGTASACARLRSKAVAKIEPSAAMPVAMPTWRNVELTPDAMPAWCGGTTPIAVEASGGLTIQARRPELRDALFLHGLPGSRRVVQISVFRDTRHLYEYLTGELAGLPGVSSVQTAPIIRTLKRTGSVH